MAHSTFDPPLDNGALPMGEVLRTPDHHFENLPDFAFTPHYFESHSHGQLRIHYLDEGPRDGETILLMHGEPSWCFLYRHMIPPLVAAGFRVVAPDLVGFGRSDKPSRRVDHSYERHVDWMAEWLVGLRLNRLTCFLQDWGGLIGLRLVARFPERFLRVVVANTALPTGGGAPESFKVWASDISQRLPLWGTLISSSCVRKLSKQEAAAYDAPFPSEAFKLGTRELPRLVPQFADHASVEENQGAWRRVFKRWKKPFLTLFSDSDPVSKGGEKVFQDLVPGAQAQAHEIIQGGGHFLQEDKPQELCQKILAFIANNPVNPTAKL